MSVAGTRFPRGYTNLPVIPDVATQCVVTDGGNLVEYTCPPSKAQTSRTGYNILSLGYYDPSRENDQISVSDHDGANSVGEAHMKMSQPE